MALFANLKIKTFVSGGVLLLAALPLASSVLSYTSLESISKHMDYTADNSVPSINALAEIDGSINDARVDITRHIASPSQEETQAMEQALQQLTALVDKEIEGYQPMISDDHERGLYGKVAGLWDQWKTKSTDVRSLSLNLQNEQALATYSAELKPVDEALDAALAAQIDYNIKLATENVTAGKAEGAKAQSSAILAAMLAGALAAVIAFMFFRRVIVPLTRIGGSMETMAAGELDTAVPYTDQGDEIGGIARALGDIKDAVAARARTEAERQAAEQQLVVSSLAAGLSALRDGQLTWKIAQAFPTEYEALRNDFNQTMSELAATMQEVARASQAVRNGAGEIASAATDLSVRTEGQAAALEESAAAVRQLSSTVQATASTAGEARSTAANVQKDAEDGGAVMLRAVEAIEEIARSSSKMEAIINVIDGIAFQTNLLALNAGVEAARAGDAGRGFAVVASEVRSLAQRSADAAKEIAEIIRASGRDVTNGVQMIGQTQTALAQIVERTTRLSTMIAEIAHSTVEQSDAIRQVNTVVNEMDKITQQNAALVEESTAASQSLANEAITLGGMVERFDLGTARGESGYRLAA